MRAIRILILVFVLMALSFPGNRVNALTFEESAYGPELWVATEKGVSVNGTLAGRWDRLDSGPGRHHVTLPCRSGQAGVNQNGIYILLFRDGETNISKKILILK